MGLFSFLGKVSTWRDHLQVCLPILFFKNGFVKSTKYLESSLIKSCSIGYYSIKSKDLLTNEDHALKFSRPIENSPILQLFRQPTTFNLSKISFFQQMWFLSATGTNLTYKVDALNETKAICLLPSEIDLKETHKVKSLSTLKKN
jgi:hypothetical protein